MALEASWKTSSQTRPISIKPQNRTTNQMLDGPALTLTGVRLTGLMVKSFFLRTLDLGMATFADSRVTRCDDVTTSLTQRPYQPRIGETCSRWISRDVPGLDVGPPRGASVSRWCVCWRGYCWQPPTASPVVQRSGAATRRGWSTWSVKPSSP